MAEWSIAAVLKTVDLHGSGGSNPSLSANLKVQTESRSMSGSFCFCKKPNKLGRFWGGGFGKALSVWRLWGLGGWKICRDSLILSLQ